MLALTHLIVTLLFIQIFLLDRNDAFVALVFGVFIDLDHLMGLRDYTQANGMKAVFDLDHLMNPGGHWKSVLHTPIGLAIVGPLAFASRLAIPLVFWSLHIAMDFVQEGFLGQFSQAEAMLAFFSGSLLVTLRYSKYLESGREGTLLQYLRSEMSSTRGMFAASGSY
jgi:hypothetical protein